MGNAHYAQRLKQGNSFQTEGSKIMQLAEVLRPYIAEWLKDHRNSEGLAVQPATIRGVALNTAQTLIKQSV